MASSKMGTIKIKIERDRSSVCTGNVTFTATVSNEAAWEPIDAALRALESQYTVLQGQFFPG